MPAMRKPLTADEAANYRTAEGGARPPTAEEIATMPVFDVAAFQKKMAAPLKVAEVAATPADMLARYDSTFPLDADQDGTGCCTGCGATTAVQWTALNVQNVALPRLSWGFSYLTASNFDTTFSKGSSVSYCAMNRTIYGCAKDVDYSQASVMAMFKGVTNPDGTYGFFPPSQATYADALTRKVLKASRLTVTGSARLTLINQLLDSGHALAVALGNHAFCLASSRPYDSNGRMYLCKDSKLGNNDEGFGRGLLGYSWDGVQNSFYDIAVIEEVDISGAPPPPPPQPGPGVYAAQFIGADATTQGNWKGKYGAQGHWIAGIPQVEIPNVMLATPAPEQVVVQQTNDPRGLARDDGGYIAARWRGPVFILYVGITDDVVRKISLYFVDWESAARSMRVEVFDIETQAIFSTQTIDSFAAGRYLTWRVSGRVAFRFTSLAGPDAVLSGVFVDADGAVVSPPPPPPPPVGVNKVTRQQLIAAATALPETEATQEQKNECVRLSNLIVVGAAPPPPPPPPPPVGANTATYIGKDTTTKGNWKGVYGAQGSRIVGDSTAYPSYATVTPNGAQEWVWAPRSDVLTPDADARALQRATSGRIAACWYGDSFTLDVNLTDGAAHKVSLYLLDWDNKGRDAKVEILDGATVLTSQQASAYGGGAYLSWTIKGRVTIKVSHVLGPNVVASGLFFDA